jgi:hypothetical protein
MNAFRNLALGLFFMTSTSLASSVKSGLTYESNNENFILKKECVSSIRFNQDVFDSEIHFSTSTQLKNSKECSQKLNSIIKNNRGGRLQIYFNSKLLIDSFIASEISTEKGFRMPVENERSGKEIVQFYNKNN